MRCANSLIQASLVEALNFGEKASNWKGHPDEYEYDECQISHNE
jgi:hypothetical protein